MQGHATFHMTVTIADSNCIPIKTIYYDTTVLKPKLVYNTLILSVNHCCIMH